MVEKDEVVECDVVGYAGFLMEECSWWRMEIWLTESAVVGSCDALRREISEVEWKELDEANLRHLESKVEQLLLLTSLNVAFYRKIILILPMTALITACSMSSSFSSWK